MPPGSEFSHFSYKMAPHVREVLELWDDPSVRVILLVWGTRMMKTSTMISLLIFAGVFTPRPMVWGGPDEDSVDSDFADKHYPMLEQVKETKWQLLPPNRRGRKAIKLRRCRIRKAYSGGKATVAGYPACYVFVTEADKWTNNKSSEADAVDNIRDRNKGYPLESKTLIEGTPGEISKSRVWKLLKDPTTDQRLLYVPCPHCGEYQILERGTKDSPYGLKWKKRSDGKKDIALAEATAYYECRHCHEAILDHHRHDMIRRCRWVSKGQSIDKHGKITGEPDVRSSTVALGPCSSLYSLWFGWGQAAKEILQAGRDKKKIQKVQNSFFAEAFDERPEPIEPHEVAKRLCDLDLPLRLVPKWGVFLTRGVDVQASGNVFVWVVVAWGPGGRGHLVDYGVTEGVEEFQQLCAGQSYRHADGGAHCRPAITMIDSSDATKAVYALCRNWKGLGTILPTKGSSVSDFPTEFRVSPMDEDDKPIKARNKVRRGGLMLIMVNVKGTNEWIVGHLNGTHEETAVASLTLPDEVRLDFDFLTQLTNEYEDDKGNWKKTGCNDYRDAFRLAYVGECWITNHGKHRNSLPARPDPSRARKLTDQRPKKPNPYTEGSGRWDEQ